MAADRTPVTFKFDEHGSSVLRKWQQKRALEAQIAAHSRRAMRQGFAGGAISRLTASLTSYSRAVNADLDSALLILRARARDLAANNEFGRRFLAMVAANVIGARGPALQVKAKKANSAELDKDANAAIESHWAEWQKSCDVRGQVDFAHLQRMVIKAVARDGEALVRPVRNRNLPYGLQLQLLEVDRLDESINRRLDSGNLVRMGVEFDSALRPVAYWVRAAHPGENYYLAAPDTLRIPARDLYHLYIPERAEQARGFTWFHAVLMRLAMLHGYEEAAVIAARVGASKVGFFEQTEDADPAGLEQLKDGDSADGIPQMNVEPGEFQRLPRGYKLSEWNPQYPDQNFEAFLKQCLRGVASGLDVATHNLVGDMTDVNYSSARIAELGEREAWTAIQEWFIGAFVRPVYMDWLAGAMLSGQITFPESGKPLPAIKYARFAAAGEFQGRRWSWVDPLKDAQAAALLISTGLSSRTRICAAQGVEFEDVVAELEAERKALEAAGLPTSSPKPSPKPGEEPGEGEEGGEMGEGKPGAEGGKGGKGLRGLARGGVNVIFERGAIEIPERNVNLEAQINLPGPAGKVVEEIERDGDNEIKRITRTTEAAK